MLLWRLNLKSFPCSTIIIDAKDFLTIYMAFLEFAHTLWEPSIPTIVLTGKKSVIGFFQTKVLPSSLWNACDYVLQFDFKNAHIAGSVNTAADFLSMLEQKITAKICLKILEDVQTEPIKLIKSSSDDADEEHFFFPKRMVKMRQESRHLNEGNNPLKRQQNGQQKRNHPQPNQLLRISQGSRETIRFTPYTESRQMHGYEYDVVYEKQQQQ